MNTIRRIHTQAQAIDTLITELRRRLPAALTHALDITADGYSTGTHNGNRSRNAVADPVHQAVLNRDRTGTNTAITHLERTLANIATHLADALNTVDRLSPPPGSNPRCYGGHLPGAHIPLEEGGWWQPCFNIPDGRPSYQGLCNSCFQKRRRWQQRQTDEP